MTSSRNLQLLRLSNQVAYIRVFNPANEKLPVKVNKEGSYFTLSDIPFEGKITVQYVSDCVACGKRKALTASVLDGIAYVDNHEVATHA